MKYLPVNIKKHIIAFIPALFLVLFISCDDDRNKRGWSYMPDMENSRAYETYSSNPNFNDSMTMRQPVEGTVPRGKIPFQYEKTEEALQKAGEKLQNPFGFSAKAIADGKTLYGQFCIHCHGEKGDGQGHLYTSGLYPYPPGNIISEKVQNRPDGEIFHIISAGYGIMGEHGSMIPEDDRWKIITYIRMGLQDKIPE